MSVRSVIQSAEIALNANNINLALRLIHKFVENIITEPICTSQVFSSFELDQLCLRIGRRNLANLPVPERQYSSRLENHSTIVYVASRLQRSGGHSRLIQDFIRSQPEKNHLILSTEIGSRSDIEFFSNLFSNKENVRFVRAPSGNFHSRLNWLQSTLLSIQPEHIYLYNHHQDSVAVAALVPELELVGSFCHHGDHHLCLGVNMCHLNHIDFHPMGFHHCRDELGIENTYVPLTFEDKKNVPFVTDFMQGGNLITATAAGWNKIEVPYYISYLDTIPRVLEATGGLHVHIGRLTPWALFRIYRQMRKRGIKQDRFIYIKWSPSVWKTLQEYKVDVYLSSFPYGAGLTLIEAMGAGVPVIMHKHMYSRILSGLELAYPDAFRWSNPEELLSHLETLRPEKLKKEKCLSRSQYERYHQPKILKTYFSRPEAFQVDIPELSRDFSPRLDEWAYFVAERFGFRYVALKYIIQNLRKFRRTLRGSRTLKIK